MIFHSSKTNNTKIDQTKYINFNYSWLNEFLAPFYSEAAKNKVSEDAVESQRFPQIDRSESLHEQRD